MEYQVIWTIEIDATSPEHAARQARYIQRDRNSLVGVFDVSWFDYETGVWENQRVDLDK